MLMTAAIYLRWFVMGVAMASTAKCEMKDQLLQASISENLRQGMSSLLTAATATDTNEWAAVREALDEVQARCARVLRIMDAKEKLCFAPLNTPED
jgi:hypothetical protein